MVNMAVLLKDAGFIVSGSDDNVYEPAASILRESQIDVKSPYRKENIPGDDTPIIIGNAQSRGHVEVEAALNIGADLFSFPEFLHRFVLSGRHTIVVAGTHGKSSTTACIAHLLKNARMNPGYLIGALPVDSPTGAAVGYPGSPFVVEGDEYDSAFFDKRSKFLHYFPHTLVLGPVEFDHADIFASLDDMLLSFRRLVNLLPSSGTLIFDADSTNACDLASCAPCRTISVGDNVNADWQLHASRDLLAFRSPDHRERRFPFAVPGSHNRKNALMAIAAAHSLDVPIDVAGKAAASFKGLRRRFERLYGSEQLIVFDDFAHHPTAIKATLQALRESFADRRLIAVFEPRSNTMVRNLFQSEMPDALHYADLVVMGSIHRKDRIAEAQRINPDAIKEHLATQNIPFVHLDNHEILNYLIKSLDAKPTVVVFMSNGGFDGIPHEFVRRVAPL